MPKNTQIFYDDAHFTDHGSAMVAERLSQFLLDTEPLSRVRL